MYDKLIAQAEQFFKPIEEIMALQTQTLEAITQQQSAFMSGVWDESVSYAQNLAGQNSVDALVKSQQEYMESVQNRMRSAAEESLEILTTSSDKMGSLWQDSFPSVNALTAQAEEGAKAVASTAKSASEKASASKKSTSSGKSSSASKKASSSTSNSKSAQGSHSAHAGKASASKASSSSGGENQARAHSSASSGTSSKHA